MCVCVYVCKTLEAGSLVVLSTRQYRIVIDLLYDYLILLDMSSTADPDPQTGPVNLTCLVTCIILS